MKNVINRFGLFVLTIAVTALSFQSCKKKYDEPPTGDLPNITANATIADIKALHAIGDSSVMITEEKIIEGIVVSSDESGNFFKQLVIQDATGGLEIRIEQSNLYNDFPVGRQVFVKCNGLFVGDYQGNHQLGAAQDTDEPAGVVRLPEGLVPEHIIGGALNQTVTPNIVTVADLTSSTQYRNTLVQIVDAQFAPDDTAQMYANAAAQQSENREVTTCSGGSILLRSSGFADFASELTPTGKGTITAVHTMFGSDAQLYIRDVNDIDFTNPRCTIDVPGNLISIAALRANYTGSTTNSPANTKVRGYVISDRSTNNEFGQNMVVMDENQQGGILVRFATNHNIDVNSYIEFSVEGTVLDEYQNNNLLQLQDLDEGSINIITVLQAVPPIQTDLTTLLANPEDYESTLVKINDITITGDATFGFNDITDGTNTLEMFTGSSATFASDPVPTTCQNITAIFSQYQTDYQVKLRNPATDLEAGSNCQGGGSTGNETVIPLDSVRILFNAGTTSIPGSRKISGTIISDGANGNIFADNFVIQDATGGIQVRLTANHTFALGDSVEVIVSGASLGESSNLLRIGNSGGVSNSNVTIIATGKTVTPRIATVADLLANAEDWESTLVTVQSATIGGGSGNYGFNTVTDATNTIDMYTPSAASFYGQAYPTSTVSVTAILGQFNADYQLRIRNTTDVQ